MWAATPSPCVTPPLLSLQQRSSRRREARGGSRARTPRQLSSSTMYLLCPPDSIRTSLCLRPHLRRQENDLPSQCYWGVEVGLQDRMCLTHLLYVGLETKPQTTDPQPAFPIMPEAHQGPE